MKKRILQQITCLILVIALAMPLCACGSSAGKAGNENAALAKEHVYRFQEITAPDFGEAEAEICASAYRDQTISLLIKVTDWNDYNENDIRILRFREDGFGETMSSLETIPWYPAAEDDASPSETSFYENYTFGADGRIYAIRTCCRQEGQTDTPDAAATERYLCCWDMSGKQLRESRLEDFPSADNQISVNALSITADGVANLVLTGDQVWQTSVNSRGTCVGSVELTEEAFQIFQNSTALLHPADGSLLLIYHSADSWEEQYLIPYDPATASFGKARMVSWDGYGAVAVGPGSGLLYSSRTGICACVPGNAAGTEKMNFINSDLNVSSFDALVDLDGTSFAGAFHEGSDSKAHIGIFTYVNPADVPDKTVLTLGGLSVNDQVMQHVVAFNRNSDRYRIVVQDMEEFDSDQELEAGITEMTDRILSGDVPDILVTEGLPADTYAARGLLADIGELIENDETLSPADFLQNVFDACSVDGKLYYVIPCFTAHTMIGAPSVVGDRASWTFADAVNLLESLPEGTNLIPEASRATFLQTMMAYCGGSLIDAGTGDCLLQSQSFVDMMEYAKSLPEESDADSYGEDYWRGYEAQYRDGRTVLAGMTVTSFGDVSYYMKGIFGEEASCIGFPTEDGSGSYVSAGVSYAISAHSACPEGAWEFLRYYLTAEYQSSLETGLPVRKDAFLESSRRALSENQTCYINNEAVTLEPLTEEQMDELVALICSISRRNYDNPEIIRIVTEESEAFFAGDKTAPEIAGVIQNRVRLYLDENRK